MLAQWRRGILARGLAGAALLAVPVAVAAAIGFGNSFSGLAGGLSALASGPDNPAPAAAGAAPRGLNRAVTALAGPPAPSGGAGGGDGGGGNTGGGQGGTTAPGGATSPSGTGNGTSGGGGGSQVPSVEVPPVGGSGGGGDATGGAGGTANGIINDVTDAVGGLVGSGN
jgi:hypothetical protein